MNLTDEQRLLIQQEVQRELQKGQERNTLANEMYQIGGGIAGAGLGLSLLEPIDFIKEKQTVQNELKRSEAIKNERDALLALRDIHLGKATFEQYGEASETLRAIYQNEHTQNLLNDERTFRERINELQNGLKRGQVIHAGRADADPRFAEHQQLISKQKNLGQYKRLIPGNNMFRNIGGKLMHPLVSIGGLSGVAAGKMLYNHLEDKKDSKYQ